MKTLDRFIYVDYSICLMKYKNERKNIKCCNTLLSDDLNFIYYPHIIYKKLHFYHFYTFKLSQPFQIILNLLRFIVVLMWQYRYKKSRIEFDIQTYIQKK